MSFSSILDDIRKTLENPTVKTAEAGLEGLVSTVVPAAAPVVAEVASGIDAATTVAGTLADAVNGQPLPPQSDPASIAAGAVAANPTGDPIVTRVENVEHAILGILAALAPVLKELGL